MLCYAATSQPGEHLAFLLGQKDWQSDIASRVCGHGFYVQLNTRLDKRARAPDVGLLAVVFTYEQEE